MQTAGVLPFPYRLERIVDDLILISYLVGNDFLPNLPTLYIPNGGLPAVFGAYKRILPTLCTSGHTRRRSQASGHTRRRSQSAPC